MAFNYLKPTIDAGLTFVSCTIKCRKYSHVNKAPDFARHG